MEEKETIVRRVIREVDDFGKIIKEIVRGENKIRDFLVLVVLFIIGIFVSYDKLKAHQPTQPKEIPTKTTQKPESPTGTSAEEKKRNQASPLSAGPLPKPSLPQKPLLSSPPIDSRNTGDDKHSGVIAIELRDKNLINKLRDADKRLDLEKDADQEVALRLYRETINRLSPNAHKFLNQVLLTGADDDYRAGRNKEAVNKYRDLFAVYL